MTYHNSVLGPLADRFAPGGLYAAWLSGAPIAAASSATEELQQALTEPGPERKAPLWESTAFGKLLPAGLRDLPHGPAVVVTGQQPGYLGGPLLTLFKIATTIILAKRRNAAGLPTVPVFWSGDDDDDLAEALAPVGWDPQVGQLVHSGARNQLGSSASQRKILSDVGATQWTASMSELLSRSDNPDDLQRDLLGLLKGAVSDQLPWGAGQAQLIARIFADTDLIIIRGHDSQLHAVATPFYDQIKDRLTELAALAQARGDALVAAGFHAQINARSLHRPLFQIIDGQRTPFADQPPNAAADLRPGVMLRSPVQDWLLRPVAVVVGPGELAYLRQLDPLYTALDLHRSALVPRLSGWVLPCDNRESGLLDLVRPVIAKAGPDAAALADRVVGPAQAEIEKILRRDLGISSERSIAMAESRARRFRKGLASMFSDEVVRQEKQRVAAAPQWVLPTGLPQERALGLISALALWGQGLVDAILQAAEQHFIEAEQGTWQESAITVPEGTVQK